MTLRRVSALIPLVMLPLGLWLGYRAFGDHSPAEVVAAVGQIPPRNLALATLFTLASYTCLTGFDAMALHYLGRTLPYPKIALTSFVSLSIGHNVGVAALSSGTLRYRFYSEAGLSAVEVGKIILFCGVTVGLGLGTLGGLVLALRPGPAGAMIGIDPAWARAAGVGLLALAAGYVLAAARVRRPLRLRGHEIGLPRPRLAAAQIVLGTANFAFVAAVLHQLLAVIHGFDLRPRQCRRPGEPCARRARRHRIRDRLAGARGQRGRRAARVADHLLLRAAAVRQCPAGRHRDPALADGDGLSLLPARRWRSPAACRIGEVRVSG